MRKHSFIIHFTSCIFSLILIFSPFIIPPKLPFAQTTPHTNSRWIVDGSGRRVKLACINWVTHLDPVVAEGLSKQPVDEISKSIIDMGFNCVRLTWALYLATNETLGTMTTVRQSFNNLGLYETISGLQAHNPSILDLSLMDAFQAVVASLAKNNVMIILDNQISKPGWCCSNFDGNGFFGDKYFNPNEWIKGLTKMATMFNGTSNVVGMSLRNELRGPKQNVSDWYRYMQKGAEAVHAANPNVLVILSGLSYDKDLSFLKDKPVNLTFTGKLVYEVHWYGFTNGDAWIDGNPNQVCGQIGGALMKNAFYLLDQGYPLFMSEFGIDQRGINENDNRYFNCFMGLAAELDFDWALWTIVGSYYLREGVVGMNEYYGVKNWNWCDIRNASFLQRLSVIQSPFQGPSYADGRLYKAVFHPMTGLCVIRNTLIQPLQLGPCSKAEKWNYTPQKTLTIKGTYFCLQADQLGKPAKLGIICTDSTSKWEAISDSKMHLSSKLKNGGSVCLDVDSNNVIVTNTCKCQSGSKCDPGSQWFKIIDSMRDTDVASKSSYLQIPAILFDFGKELFGGLVL
ncbi:hypothetical protein Leryth_018083 [Lithospermum erythrorhizon]|nr:hypothetical protein Leryth_018083 [Lithospermum erythrorhizon]